MNSDESKKENAPQPDPHVSPSSGQKTSPKKRTKKQIVLDELKEVLGIIAYIAGSLCILQTYKSLILLQLGIYDFVHNYAFAIVEALLTGKIVAVAQKVPLLNAFENRPLALVILFRSFVMTVIVDIGGIVEDHMFPKSAHMIAQSGNPMALEITHQLACMSIFIVLFAVRGLDGRLGPGTLWNIFFKAPPSPAKD